MNAKQLNELANNVFGKKGTLNSLHQEIADNFYPERADFTLRRQIGDEFADHLMTSYPVLVRRELADQIGTFLRPKVKPWFKMVPSDSEREDNESKRWLEWATGLMRRAMYDPITSFSRAMKEGDNDFATFGQPAISIELVWDSAEHGPHLLYRCWHLRDMAWQENRYGKVGNRFRRWKPCIYDLNAHFPGKLHQNITSRLAQHPLDEIDVMHLVVEAPYYDKKPPAGQPYWSIYYDCMNEVVIEDTPVWCPIYAIPRWQTVGGSQYAYSPATIVALPDARLLQAMTVTLLEAGEKITNPPMVATDEVVRGDIALYAGGITIVDRDYDEKLGEALRPLTQDAKGMPIGIEMQQDSRRILAEAFYLNKLKLPQRTSAATAYEISQLVQQYIRDALPLFEPIEENYNGDVCNFTFEVLRRGNAFGSPYMMPRNLQGQEVSFRFMSPLHDEIDAIRGQKFLEMKSLVIEAAALDKSVIAIPDAKKALRDALTGIGVPATWQRSETTVREMELAQQSIDQAEQAIAALGPATEAAANVAGAQKDMAQARSLGG